MSTHAIQNGTLIDDVSAVAGFAAQWSPPSCGSATHVGSCTVSCADSAGVAEGVPAVTSAGVIMVSGAAVPLVLRPDSMPTPYFVDISGQRGWTGGEPLLVAATGGVIPAFLGKLIAPAQVTVTSPTVTHNSPQSGLPLLTLTIDRTRDLVFSWMPTASSATVDIGVSSTSLATNTTMVIDCQFDVGLGQGTVPSSALAALAPGPGVVGVGSSNSRVVEAGDWSVTLRAQTAGVTPDGVEFYVATLQ
jgi:hypothetical protein